MSQPGAAGATKVLLRGIRAGDINAVLAKHLRMMRAEVNRIYALAAVVAAGEHRDKRRKQSDFGAASKAPAGKEALPAVDIASACSAMAILQAVAKLAWEVRFIATSAGLYRDILELGGSGWEWERCAFSRLLERLLEVPGAARLVLKYLGELDQEPELEADANVIAVLLSSKLGEEEFECSASLVQDAADRDDPDLIHVLSDAGADIDTADGRAGRTPLHVASANGRVRAVEKLLELGANALRKDQQGRTAVDLAANEEAKAAFAEFCEEVEITDGYKDALLLLCARLGNASRLPAVLQAGANPAHTDEAGKTSLATACENQYDAAAAELVEATKNAGALDLQDNNHKLSALHVASANGLRSTVARLLSVGAKPELADQHGMTALALACVKLGNLERLSGGGAAAAETADGLAVGRWVRATVTFTSNNAQDKKEVPKGALGKVASFDKDGDAWIDFEGLDAKQCVLKSNFGNISVLSQEDVLKERAQREELVAMLIAPTQAAGALDVQNDEGATSLMHASMHGLWGVVELLVAAGARPELINKRGMTALLLACANAHEEAAARLVPATKAAGAFEAVGNDGMSNLSLAIEKDLVGMVRELLAAGAKPEPTALALACVKLCNMERLSGGGAAAAETADGLAVGRWVRATVTFTSNNAQDKREVPKGALGKVAEIHEDGHALIYYEGLDAKQWVLKSNFGNISVLSQEDVLKERARREELVAMLIAPTHLAARDERGMTALALACVKLGNLERLSGGGAAAAETADGLAVGRWVRATVTFTSNTAQDKKEVPKGALGKVASFDKNGNAWIDFEGLDAKQGVLKSNFGNISVLSQEDVLKERAQREELVAMLIAPTQAASALDVQNDEGATSLMHASMHGLWGVVELLVAAGARPEITDKRGMTALLLACANAHEAAATRLVAATKAAGALDAVGNDGMSSLVVAIEKDLVGMVRELLAAGAKPELADKHGMTALALACVKLGNLERLSGGGASAVETADGLAVGRWVRATVTFTSNTAQDKKEVPKGALGKVASFDKNGNAWIDFEGLDAKQGVLKSNFGNISVLSQEDVLKERAQREELVAMLIAPTQAAGALDVQNDEGATSLMHASMHGLWGVVELLVAAGARPAITDKRGMTALLLACANAHEAAATRLVAATKAAGALDAVGNDGMSSLVVAIEKDLVGMVRELLAAGAKPELADKHGMTALALACVKLGNLERLSGGGASAVETADGLAVGRWVRATVTFTSNTAQDKKEVPKGALGKVASFDKNGNAWIDFEGLDAKQGVLKSNFGNISVLSQEDVLKERARREELVAMLIAPTQAAGALDVQNDEGATSLMHASMHGLWGVVELLVAAGARPAITDKRGMTALLLACANAHEAAATRLVAATKAAGALDAVGNDGMSSLVVAIEKDLVGMVRELLAAGAKPELADKHGMTALALACVKLGNLERLSGGGAAADETFLNEEEAQRAVRSMQLDVKSAICAKLPPGRWAAMTWVERLACFKSGMHKTEDGLAVGRWVRVTSDASDASSTVTFTSNNPKDKREVPKGALGKVAEIYEDGHAAWIDFEGLDAKQCVLKSNFGNISVLSQEDVLKERAQREELVAMLIAPTQAAGALDVQNDEGATSLMHASMHGLWGVVELLVAAGARPELINKRGMTALLLACANAHEKAAAQLVVPTHATGALNVVGGDGFSALLWAEERGLDGVAQSLRECGATVLRRPLALFRGEWGAVQVDMKERTVTFAGSFATVRSAQRCPLGGKGYYELEILEVDVKCPQYGFASAAFARVLGAKSGDGVGDDAHSWAVDGARQLKWPDGPEHSRHPGSAATPYKCTWQAGDVIGLACDLDKMQMHVSVNGSFAAPNGLVFELAPDAVGDGLFPAFSGQKGKVCYNLGEAHFRHAPPAAEYQAFADFEG